MTFLHFLELSKPWASRHAQLATS